MTNLKGGNVIGIRTADGKTIRNDDGSPLTFIVEDARGEIHELYMSLGRMGTFVLLTLPPFEVTTEGDYGDGRAGETQQDIEAGVPRATIPRRSRTSRAGA